MKYFLLLTLIFCMSSCAVLDYPKRIAGYSTANFENEQNGRFSFNCDLEPRKAYNKCNLFLFENNLQTNFKSDKKMYVVASKFTLIYEYTLDSTEVAFFVYETEDNKSKIDVVSNNSRLAKFVYDKLVAYMQK
ncbi:MAG: hypothetical protein K5622_06900 [Endomicrobiaceae bacterium]|nr:hypothetical protein [Endomicrobiaceae bacterium]